MNPVEVLRSGAAELDFILEPAGFYFVETSGAEAAGERGVSASAARG